MKTKLKIYNIDESIARINRILNVDNNIIKQDGYYDMTQLAYHQTVICNAICLSVYMYLNIYDINNDENLNRQYKCMLSEFGAIINECSNVIEICVLKSNIITCLINTPNNQNYNSVIDTAAKITSLMSILNKKFVSMGLKTIEIGVGVNFDSVKITRESFSNTIDDTFLWSGPLVENSIKLSQMASTGLLSNSLMINKNVYDNLSENYRQFFTYDTVNDCFAASLINKQLNQWSKENL